MTTRTGEEETGAAGIRRKAGFVFLGFSVLFYLLIAVVPLLGLSTGSSAIIITVLIIIAELSFLVSLFLLGRELARKYRAYFNPLNWFKKKELPIEKEDKSSHLD